MADPAPEACLTRDKLLARYGELERADAATVLRLVGQPAEAAPHAMAWRYPSVEAFEAYATANRIHYRIQDHGITQHGPAVTEDGVFGVLLILPPAGASRA